MSEAAIDTAHTDTQAEQSTSTDQSVETPVEGQTTAVSEDQAQSTSTQSQEGNAFHGAPESYADLEVPEGVQVFDDILAEYKDVGKKLDLNQDGMQELTNLAVKLQQRGAEQMLSAYQQQQDDWLSAVKADESIGGAQYDTTKSMANLAIDKYGNDALAALMQPFDPKDNPNGTGLGGHPEVMRFLAQVGKTLSPDSSTQSAGATLSMEEQLQKLYPNTKV